MLSSATVNAPPDAFAIARALADRPGVVLARGAGGKVTYVACDPIAESAELDPEPGLDMAPRSLGEIPRWFGLLPYEARRSLERHAVVDLRPAAELARPLWRRYACIAKIANKVEVFGREARALEELRARIEKGIERPPRRPPVALRLAAPPEPASAHRARIGHALDLIRAGDIYQVNLARRFELSATGTGVDVLAALGARGLPPYSFALDWPELSVAMASPELFLELSPSGRIQTRPIKGTRPRLDDPVADAALARELDADPKERAELAMVIDVERNDLGRLAVPGSVRLTAPPAVETHGTVHHRAATIEALLVPGISRQTLLAAMLPSGSVTGAPKIRAMEVIRELEPARRGLYTGAAGFVREDGGLELGMAIRTVVMREGRGAYYAGGGIVADSDPDREVEETLWKASALMALVGTGENWA